MHRNDDHTKILPYIWGSQVTLFMKYEIQRIFFIFFFFGRVRVKQRNRYFLFFNSPQPSSRTEYRISNEKMNLSNEHDLIGNFCGIYKQFFSFSFFFQSSSLIFIFFLWTCILFFFFFFFWYYYEDTTKIWGSCIWTISFHFQFLAFYEKLTRKYEYVITTADRSEDISIFIINVLSMLRYLFRFYKSETRVVILFWETWITFCLLPITKYEMKMIFDFNLKEPAHHELNFVFGKRFYRLQKNRWISLDYTLNHLPFIHSTHSQIKLSHNFYIIYSTIVWDYIMQSSNHFFFFFFN